MTGQSHIAIGAASVVLVDAVTHLAAAYPVAIPLPLPNAAILSLGLAVAGAIVGALLPDIDHPQSKIAHQTGLAHGRGPLTDVAGSGLRALLGGHRGFTHSALAAGLISLAAVLALPLAGAVGLGVALGYLSHIAADMLTKEGVRFWWPVSRRDVGLGPRTLRFRTGSLVEYALVTLVWAVTLFTRWGALALSGPR